MRATDLVGRLAGRASRAETDSNELLCSFHVRMDRTARLSVPDRLKKPPESQITNQVGQDDKLPPRAWRPGLEPAELSFRVPCISSTRQEEASKESIGYYSTDRFGSQK